MGPVKFDDFPKLTNDLMNDDYQIGFQFKAKQKTCLDGATATTTLDVWPPKEAAKLTWKFPKIFGLAGIVLDKLELDKKGLVKVEASADKNLHSVSGLKVEVKSGLLDPANVTAAPGIMGTALGLTFTGIKNTQIKLDAKPLGEKPSCTVEVCHATQNNMFGVKCGSANMSKPDFGFRHVQGPLLVSALFHELASVKADCYYALSDDLKLACTYQHGSKKQHFFGLGMSCVLQKGTSLKVKVMKDMTIHAGLKQEVTKGFNMLAGWKYEIESGKPSFGLQVSLE